MQTHWNKLTLGDLGQIITGKTPPTQNSLFWNGNIPFITPKDIQSSKHILTTERYLSQDGANTVKSSILPKGSICVSCIGNIGYIGKTTELSVSNQQINSIIPNSFNDTDFVYYLMKSLWTYFKNYEGQSTALSILNKSQFSKIEVTIPPLEVQKKIAGVLGALDDKIELNNKINQNLEAQAQALFYKIYKSEQNAILGDIISIIESGSRPKGGALKQGIPSIGAENIEKFGIYDYSKEKFISTEFYNNLKRGKVLSGDVMLYKDGAYTGKVSMSLDGFPHQVCAVNEHVFLLRANTKRASQFFLYFCLLDDKNRQKIFKLASGKAAQPGLNRSELLSLPIYCPDFSDVDTFTQAISPLMHTIAQNSLENAQLAKLRDTLLPKLMSGGIDVDDVKVD